MVTITALLLAYLVGSVPFGYLFVRAMTGLDVRSYGSHSAGAINVSRVAGVWIGLATLVADAGKAVAVVLVTAAAHMPASTVAAAAFMVMVGHAYSLWFLVKGGRPAEGKSVACALGILIGLARIGVLPWRLALAPLVVWALGLLAPRMLTGRWYWISPATMLASLCIPAVVRAAHAPSPYLALSVAMTALILVRHRNNIKRLLAGTEPRLGQRAALAADVRPGLRDSAAQQRTPTSAPRAEGGRS